MAEPQASNNIPKQNPAVALRLGASTIEFTGLLAIVPIAIALALVVLVVYLVSKTTQTMLWVSAVLWILFIAYWTAVAGNAAASRGSESAASRHHTSS
jgi:hypothetical protein